MAVIKKETFIKNEIKFCLFSVFLDKPIFYESLNDKSTSIIRLLRNSLGQILWTLFFRLIVSATMGISVKTISRF